MTRKINTRWVEFPTTAVLRDRASLGQTWVVTLLGAVIAIIGGSLLFPQQVYDQVIWQHFWGPVYAETHAARCAVSPSRSATLLHTAHACQTAVDQGRLVAKPGYTIVSAVGYGIVFLYVLGGIVLLLRRLSVGRERRFVYSLIPFMLSGSTLVVLAEINAALSQRVISYPANILLTEPLIYGTIMLIPLIALVGSVALVRWGVGDRYDRILVTSGFLLLGMTLGWLFMLAPATKTGIFTPLVAGVILGSATGLSLVIWAGIARIAPYILSGTGAMGLVVLWAHTISGMATVIAADWLQALGVSTTHSALPPLTQLVSTVTGQVFPPSVTTIVGTAWPMLVVNILVALGFVWVIDAELFEANARLAILLTLAILTIGLVPGTTALLRLTFGV